MKPAEAAKEIVALAEELLARGGADMSPSLREFVEQLALSAGLKAVRKAKTSGGRGSSTVGPRVGPRPKRPPEADMSKTIDELAAKLRQAFNSDDNFERVLTDPATQMLSKTNVVTLYKRIFDEARPLPRSMTKPDIFNAIRRERISRVRSGY